MLKDLEKWLYKYWWLSILIILIAGYFVFVKIPFIYEIIPNFLGRVGNGRERLISQILSNFISFIFLILALLGLGQLQETKKSRKMDSLSKFFEFFYDEKIVSYKSKIKQKEDDLKSIQISSVSNDKDKLSDYEIKVENILGITKENFSQVITSYNNIAVFIKNDLMDLSDLPSMFPENTKKYWEIFETYISLRQKSDISYAKDFKFLYDKCTKK